MAGEQGTGKHPHKSAEEPYEHNEGKSTKGSSSKTEHTAESHSSGSGEQGTGKHPHKKASDPKEHHEGAKK